ncbi:MAG: DNA polymerase III subunit gamma/tau [SAR202 cluster bacterium]|nr:DNA polymerase III subunit gamma/tau [SAR202 cluster bacterium]
MPEVLYRKWRPSTLNDLVGQDHISQTLKHSVNSSRFAHAYLFCGPRGTGKTSTARILAKAINCPTPNDGDPCDDCQMCNDISIGRAIDLIEIDAASNRRIADIRDLTEKIHYTPGEAKYKVYIIDEVHMLTQEAFNALLKTLEEPPKHAVLILATTDVQKLPLTIISRCQRFDFRRIANEQIANKLSQLSDSENVKIDYEALKIIANYSTGSLRDAENILEQAIVSFVDNISVENIKEMLKIGGDDLTQKLLELIVKKDLTSSIQELNQMIADGVDINQIHSSLLDSVRYLMLIKSDALNQNQISEELKNSLNNLKEEIGLSELLFISKTLSKIDFQGFQIQNLALEMALIEINLGQPDQSEIVQNQKSNHIAHSRNQITQNFQSNQVPIKNTPTTAVPKNTTQKATDISQKNPTQSTVKREGESGKLDSEWNNLLRELRLTGKRFKFGALLRGAKTKEIIDETLVLTYSHSSNVDRFNSELEDPVVKSEMLNIIHKTLNKEYAVEVRLDGQSSNEKTSKKSGSNSNLVKSAQAMGALIVEEREKNT